MKSVRPDILLEASLDGSRPSCPAWLGRRGIAFMRKFTVVLLVALATACFPSPGHAQGTLSSLLLFTTGSGSITPFQNRQLLVVSQSYDMTAVPDSGYTFSSWQPVNVFFFTDIVSDGSGGFSTNMSTVTSLLPESSEASTLNFTMQAPQVVFDGPGVRTVTESSGWQANFAPVPEPSSLALLVCGFAALVSLRHRRCRRAAPNELFPS